MAREIINCPHAIGKENLHTEISNPFMEDGKLMVHINKDGKDCICSAYGKLDEDKYWELRALAESRTK